MSDLQKMLAKKYSPENAKMRNAELATDKAKEEIRVSNLTEEQRAAEQEKNLSKLKKVTENNNEIRRKLQLGVKSTRTDLYADDIAKAKRQNNTKKVKELEKERDDSIKRGIDSYDKDIKNGEAVIRDLDKRIEALRNPIFTTADQQALLLYNLDKFSKGYKGSPKYYGEALGNPVHARSHIFSPKGVDKFLNISNELLSSLVPRTKLYKVEKDDSQVEFVFDSHQSPSAMTASSQGRGTGAGIKSVSIDKNGDNSATADSRVGVTMSLYFSSLEEIFKDRGGYRYSDLITPDNIGKRIRLNVGYAPPIGNLWDRKDELKKVLENSERAYYLNYNGHKLDLKDNGAVSLDIEYQGYIEANTLRTDLFELTMPAEDLKQLKLAREEIEKLDKPPLKSGKATPTPAETRHQNKAKQERIKELKKLNAERRSKAYSAFLRKMFAEDKINRLSFKRSEILGLRILKNLRTEFVEPSVGEKVEAALKPASMSAMSPAEKAASVLFLGNSPSDIVNNIAGYFSGKSEVKKKKGAVRNGDEYQVEYFYLGDFLDRIFELVKKDSSFKKTDFIFGTIPYLDPATEKVISVEISKIPISMASYASWFIENVVKKGERISYNIRDFMYDLLDALVAGAFRSKGFRSEEAGTYGAGVLVPVFHTGIFNTVKSMQGFKGNYSKVNSIGSPKKKGFYTNYLVYASNSQMEVQSGDGNETEDAKKGIYHLIAGREKGLVKRIKFERSQMKYNREDLLIRGGASRPGTVFRDIYNANVELFGNPVFSPGMQVYIRTLSYDLQYARELQILGYYRIIKVSSVIEGGKYKTDVECKWEYLK